MFPLHVLLPWLGLLAPQQSPTFRELSLRAEERLAREDFAAAEEALRQASEVAPDAPLVWLRLASAGAQAGHEEAALQALERAVTLGFRDQGYLEWETAFDPLRTDAGFRAVVDRSRAQPASESPTPELRTDELLTLIALSPDGRTLLCGWRTPRLVDAGTGEILASLPEQADLRSAVFDPSGEYLVSVQSKRGVLLRRASDGSVLRTLDEHARQGKLVFSPDGKLLLCQTRSEVRLLRFPTGEVLPVPELGTCFDAWFAPDGDSLVVEGRDSLWSISIPSSSVLWHVSLGGNQVDTLCFDATGKWIAYVDDLHRGYVLDRERGMPAWKHLLGWEDAVVGLAFQPGTSNLAVYHSSGVVRFWQEPWTEPQQILKISGGSLVSALEFVAAGDVIVLLRESNGLYACKAANGERLWEGSDDGFLSWWFGLVAPGGELVTQAPWGHSVRWLDPRTGAVCNELDIGSDSTKDLLVLAGGTMCAVLHESGRITLVNARTGADLPCDWRALGGATFEGAGGGGRWMATRDEAGVRIWNLDAPSTRLLLPATRGLPSPSEDRILLATSGRAWIASARDGSELLELPAFDRAPSLWRSTAWSPGGDGIAYLVDGVGWLARSTSEPTALPRLQSVGEDLIDFAFSSDGARMVAGSDSGNLYEWDLSSNRLRLVAEAVTEGLHTIQYDEVRGEWIACGSLVVGFDPKTWSLLWSRAADSEAGWRRAQIDYARTGSSVPCPLWSRIASVERVVEPESMHEKAVFKLRTHVQAALGGERLLAVEWNALEAFDAADGRWLWSRLTDAAGASLLWSRSAFLAGSLPQGVPVVVELGEETRDIESVLPRLHAPRLVAAESAGVSIAPLPSPGLPELLLLPDHDSAGERPASIVIAARDAHALHGFQVQVGARRWFAGPTSPEVHLDADGRGGRLELSLGELGPNETVVAVRAVNRAGGASAIYRRVLPSIQAR